MAREALAAEVERLIHSSVLQGSESLCKLLRYLADQAIEHPGAPIKEYQIATEVFGRSADFDSRLDSTVRVQTGRLRSKLAEYYAGPGAGDQIVIEIPKGAYSLSHHSRPRPEEVAAPVLTFLEAAPPAPIRVFPAKWFFLSVVIGAAMVVVIGMALARYFVPASGKAPESLRIFWKGFIDGPEAPLVVYSNAEFVGRPETGMRYFNPSTDKRESILDHYTGVGEVMAVHELERVFTSLPHAIRIKRGRLLTWDDARSSDLIFVGSPSENLSLRELPGTQDFVFTRLSSEPRKGDLAIANRRPDPGEASIYLASSSLPVSEDYALVGLTPGLHPNRWVLILAGLTTFGTQAAVEFVCRPARVEELLAKLGDWRKGKVIPFEAVLKVKISGGVPVQSELVALHAHGPKTGGQ